MNILKFPSRMDDWSYFWEKVSFRWMHVYISASVEASVVRQVHRVGFIERKFARASSVIISLDTTRYQLCTFTHKVQFVKRGWRCTCTFAMTWTCCFLFLWCHHPALFRCCDHQDVGIHTYTCRPKLFISREISFFFIYI